MDYRHDHLLAAHLGRSPARLALASLPTPVERARWLEAAEVEVYVKRDDQTGGLYGGGKVRKLEWSLANPPFTGDAPIVSIGGFGSHHLLALALYLSAQRRSLHALIFDQTPTAHALHGLAVLLSCRAQLWYVKTRPRLAIAWLAYHTWARPTRLGTFMPPGGTTGVGCLGFVEAGLELAAQVAAGAMPAPRIVYVAGGSGGTAVGLALGLALAGLPGHVRVVSALERMYFGPVLFRRTMRTAFATLVAAGLSRHLVTLGPAGLLARAGVTWSIDHAHIGDGYGVPTAAAHAAVALAADRGGLTLETTYTGKCLAALRADLATGAARGPVLFWLTHAGTAVDSYIKPGWQAQLPSRLRRRLVAAGVLPEQ